MSDFKGKKLLLYFYLKVNTGDCTNQAISVRDAKSDLDQPGAAAVGMSPDLPDAQKNFEAKQARGFPVLSDADHKVADACGTWGEKSLYGKEYEGIIRSSSLIDQDGKVIDAWYKVSTKDTVPKTLKALEGAA